MALDSTPLAELVAALERAVPSGVVVAAEDPAAPPEGLFDAEALAMARAAPARRAEFAAGRRAAHRAMERLGLPPAPVAMGPDRAPVWPRGLIGSISHCEGACVALVAQAGTLRAVAVDVEPDADLPGELVPVVCSESERAWLSGLAPGMAGRMARLIFSAKECVYKLQFPVTGKLLEFSDMEVDIDLLHQQFSTRFTGSRGVSMTGWCPVGRFGMVHGILFSVSHDL